MRLRKDGIDPMARVNAARDIFAAPAGIWTRSRTEEILAPKTAWIGRFPTYAEELSTRKVLGEMASVDLYGVDDRAQIGFAEGGFAFGDPLAHENAESFDLIGFERDLGRGLDFEPLQRSLGAFAPEF